PTQRQAGGEVGFGAAADGEAGLRHSSRWPARRGSGAAACRRRGAAPASLQAAGEAGSGAAAFRRQDAALVQLQAAARGWAPVASEAGLRRPRGDELPAAVERGEAGMCARLPVSDDGAGAERAAGRCASVRRWPWSTHGGRRHIGGAGPVRASLVAVQGVLSCVHAYRDAPGESLTGNLAGVDGGGA
ncbi:unnamed protein product, partial [Urochloa humidicola]